MYSILFYGVFCTCTCIRAISFNVITNDLSNMDNRTLSSKGWRYDDYSQQVGMTGEPSFKLSHHWSKLQKNLSIKCAIYKMFRFCLEHIIQEDIDQREPPFCLQGNSEVIRQTFEINMIRCGISNIKGQEDMDITRMATSTGYRR